MLLLWLIAGSAMPAHALTIKDVRFGVHPDKVRMVIELDNKTDFRAFTLESPYRMVVDLPSFEWQAGTISRPASSNVSAVRQGNLAPGISRIVFDLAKPMTLNAAFLLPRDQGRPNRLVIDFSPTTATAFTAQKGTIYGNLSVPDEKVGTKTAIKHPPASMEALIKTTALNGIILPPHKPNNLNSLNKQSAKPNTRSTNRSFEKPMIIIDAGHGGVDPGAVGANGLLEKNVTLAVAKELKRQLESTGRYKVKLTRSRDIYLRLHKRVAFARKHKADLFISLHADSIAKSAVRGASIYTLSEKASDAQTARLADKENRADLIAGIDLNVEDKLVANILVDLAMRDTMNQSNFLANTVVKTLGSGGVKILENPHRSAGFAVLKAPDVPSVLVEMGFMSNRREAKMLSQPPYQRQMARALIAGIDAYFRKVHTNNNT